MAKKTELTCEEIDAIKTVHSLVETMSCLSRLIHENWLGEFPQGTDTDVDAFKMLPSKIQNNIVDVNDALHETEKDLKDFIDTLEEINDDDDNGDDKEEYTLKCPECKTVFDVSADTVGDEPFCVECPNCSAEVDSKYIED